MAIDELLKRLFPENAEMSTEQAEAVQAIQKEFADLETQRAKDARWIREHLFSNGAPAEPSGAPNPEEPDTRPQYLIDYDKYKEKPGDFSHLLNI